MCHVISTAAASRMGLGTHGGGNETEVEKTRVEFCRRGVVVTSPSWRRVARREPSSRGGRKRRPPAVAARSSSSSPVVRVHGSDGGFGRLPRSVRGSQRTLVCVFLSRGCDAFLSRGCDAFLSRGDRGTGRGDSGDRSTRHPWWVVARCVQPLVFSFSRHVFSRHGRAHTGGARHSRARSPRLTSVLFDAGCCCARVFLFGGGRAIPWRLVLGSAHWLLVVSLRVRVSFLLPHGVG